MICLSLTEKNLEENLLQYQKNRGLIDLAELRIDLLDASYNIDALKRFPSICDKPVILACRRKRDGGSFSGSERSRVQLMKKLLDSGFRYLDLEEDLTGSGLEQLAAARSIPVIRSFQDTEQIPADLFKRMMKIHEQGEIPKASVTPQSFADVFTLFRGREELKEIPQKIVVALGNYGVPARILYKRIGSLLTYCTSSGGTEKGSGHMIPEALKNLYHADTVTDETELYGIIGNPVMHSASPAIHNPGLSRLGLNAVYVPFQVDSVRHFFSFAEWADMRGFSVTIPHKKHVLPYLGNITREVKQIGSCNTVVRSGKLWKGINTDYYGFLHPIQEDIESGVVKKALVIGAGGAARAVVWALRNFGCSVTIVNRTFERAQQLAAETGSAAIEIDRYLQNLDRHPDLIVQTTSVGMEPYIDGDPLPGYQFNGEEIVYDLIYAPKMTRILNRAGQAGCRIVFGYEMLYAQGIQQFKSFTGRDYPQF